jgi:ribosomal protein S18 acetylase RimI-like enzyme
VHPAHEEEGVGRQLLDWAEGYAISTGALRLEIVVESGNERATAFYRARGFVPKESDLLELVLPQGQ